MGFVRNLSSSPLIIKSCILEIPLKKFIPRAYAMFITVNAKIIFAVVRFPIPEKRYPR